MGDRNTIEWYSRCYRGPELDALYEHEPGPGVERPPISMAEYFWFDGERIPAIELFVGRPVRRPRIESSAPTER